jgi:hypothetical protein
VRVQVNSLPCLRTASASASSVALNPDQGLQAARMLAAQWADTYVQACMIYEQCTHTLLLQLSLTAIITATLYTYSKQTDEEAAWYIILPQLRRTLNTTANLTGSEAVRH